MGGFNSMVCLTAFCQSLEHRHSLIILMHHPCVSRTLTQAQAHYNLKCFSTKRTTHVCPLP